MIFQLNYTLIAACSGIIALFQIVWWVFRADIPRMIPHTPIHTFGAAFMLFLIILFAISFRRLRRSYSIFEMTLHGILMVMMAEIIYQPIRLNSFNGYTNLELLKEYLFVFTVMPIYAGVFGFLVAYKLKTGKIGVLLFYLFLVSFFIGILGELQIIDLSWD